MYKEMTDPKEYLPYLRAMGSDPRRLHKVTVDAAKCMGCRRCVHVCNYNVYRWDAQANQSVAAYPEECVACLQCMYYCPAGAIEVEEAPLAFIDPIFDAFGLNDGREQWVDDEPGDTAAEGEAI